MAATPKPLRRARKRHNITTMRRKDKNWLGKMLRLKFTEREKRWQKRFERRYTRGAHDFWMWEGRMNCARDYVSTTTVNAKEETK